MGVLTAVGGGMVRDVASGQIPSVFGGNPLYAVPAIFASAAMVVFAEAGFIGLGMMIAPILGTGLAIMAYWFEWVLPRGINYAPVNYTAAQMASAVKRAEKRGFKLGSNRRAVEKSDPTESKASRAGRNLRHLKPGDSPANSSGKAARRSANKASEDEN